MSLNTIQQRVHCRELKKCIRHLRLNEWQAFDSCLMQTKFERFIGMEPNTGERKVRPYDNSVNPVARGGIYPSPQHVAGSLEKPVY